MGAALAEPVNEAPFASVLWDGSAVLARLPAQMKLQVRQGSAEYRLSTAGETFRLQAGETLALAEKHASYRVTAVRAPAPGLRVAASIDARSSGGSLQAEQYFVPALQATPADWLTEFGRLAAGMSRVDAEREIARVRAIKSTYELWAMDTSASVPYRLDAETLLLVTYRPGKPAAHGIAGQGGHPPVDGVLLDYQVLRLW